MAAVAEATAPLCTPVGLLPGLLSKPIVVGCRAALRSQLGLAGVKVNESIFGNPDFAARCDRLRHWARRGGHQYVRQRLTQLRAAAHSTPPQLRSQTRCSGCRRWCGAGSWAAPAGHSPACSFPAPPWASAALCASRSWSIFAFMDPHSWIRPECRKEDVWATSTAHQTLKSKAPPTRAPPATAPLRAPTDRWPVSGR